MIYVKKHFSGYKIVVGVCDSDLIGKKFSADGMAIAISEHFFKGDMQPYMTVWFLAILAVNVAIYIFVKKVTGRSSIAFLAAIYTGLNYTGNFQFYARGHFHWFTQRVPEIFPMLASFTFLIIYVSSKKIKDYTLSIFFFIISLFMTDYTTLFLPFFSGFMIASAIFKAPSKKVALQFLFMSLPFIILNYLNVNQSALGLSTIRPHQTLWQSIIENKDVIYRISYQLVVVTIPFSLLQFISKLQHQNYQTLIPYLMLPTYIYYLVIGYFLFKKKFPSFHILVGIFLALLGVLFLNVYLKRVNVLNEVEQGRYYYIPAIYVGIIQASFLVILLDNINIFSKKAFKIGAIIFLLLIWTIININLIWKKVKDSQYAYTGGRLLMQRLNIEKSQLPDGAIVMVSNPLMPSGEDFLKKYYNNPNRSVLYMYIDSKWQSKIPTDFDLAKLFVFDYNDEYKKGGRAHLNFIKVEDKSDEYRKKLIKERSQ